MSLFKHFKSKCLYGSLHGAYICVDRLPHKGATLEKALPLSYTLLVLQAFRDWRLRSELPEGKSRCTEFIFNISLIKKKLTHRVSYKNTCFEYQGCITNIFLTNQSLTVIFFL